MVSDVRGGEYFDDLLAVLDELDGDGLEPTVLFLEADEETLVNRFKETRRRHPLAPDGRIVDGIRAERELLGAAARARRRGHGHDRPHRGDAAAADRRPTCSAPSRRAQAGADPAHLRVQERAAARRRPHPRRPLPAQPPLPRGPAAADRPRRRGGASTSRPASSASEFYGRLLPLLDFLLPAYVAEGKTHLTIAIGCTGGRHRSVTVADRIAPPPRRARRRDRRGSCTATSSSVSRRKPGRSSIQSPP